MKSFGFQPPIIEESDFWLGSGKLGSQIINEKGDWRPYLPVFEKQNKGNETNCCVSFGTLSALEILHKFLYGVEPNYSDRFLCKISDTGPNGNDPKKVSNALRHCGSVPEEEYPFVIPLDEFFKEIPMGRFGSAEEVANAALFLASDLSSYVTGQTLSVCGALNC